MKIYLAGPMRGYEDFNFPAFREAASALRQLGHEVFSPAEHDEENGFNPEGDGSYLGDFDLRQAMTADLTYITRKAEAVAVLDGWEQSLGARAEAFTAWCIGISVYHIGSLMFGGEPVSPMDLVLPDSTSRGELLTEARDLVTGDRNNSYGPPHQDFKRSADAATAYGYRGPGGRPVQAHDIAILVSLVKISRLMWSPLKKDSWTDLAGYAACGYEAALLTGEEK